MAATAPDASVIQMQRPIERLPVRRLSNEPKEAMNCKSCRKRKVRIPMWHSAATQTAPPPTYICQIKCNRLRPSCEACKVFNVECVYDAIPKKRGPKTDVLEALLKRVNGLEKRLKDEDKNASPEDAAAKPDASPTARTTKSSGSDGSNSKRKQSRNENVRPKPEPQTPSLATQHTLPFSNPAPHYQQPIGTPKDALLDLYFERLHGRPYYVLDEAATRQRFNAGQLPANILDSIHAVAARYGQHILGSYNTAVRLSDECCNRARMSLNSDEPTIENLQTSLLLASAFFQAGKGKKSYMLLSSAISMALALGLHRELPSTFRIPLAEREGRRKLFWTCYLMDRFTASGSKRPSLIGDESIQLRLPAWPADGPAMYQEGPFFANGSNVPMAAGNGGSRVGHSTYASLIEITRILGITNRYLAAGGVKGDSHFPWHSQSNLSRIRQDLEVWAASNQEVFMAVESLFSQPESLTTVLARLVYHLIHCLIYRPFLPVDLIELAGTEQHQPWQLEATNLCFLHANAIANLVEVGKACSVMDWPAFVGYCLCTAGTIHVHGAHYVGRDGDFFARSTEFLSREMSQLNEIRMYYAGVQHQRETLQTVYGCHSQLVKSLASNPMRFSPVFQMEDFFDRYPGQYIDGAHVILSDVPVEQFHETLPAYNGINQQGRPWNASAAELPSFLPATSLPTLSSSVPSKKRRRTNDDSHHPVSAVPTIENARQMVLDASEPANEAAAQSSLPTPTECPEPTATATDTQTLAANPFSPNFAFSPWPASFLNSPAEQRQTLPTQGYQFNGQMDQAFTFGYHDKETPGAMSNNGSVPSESDKDPFLSLLEQLAENENSQQGGPSDLDFFLRAQGS
ncbi:hypothetical protein CAC42_6545 [Sphaceloma murrayae]|uniref:Xylanolytic transcriptional activator regulatory domain-containing protein n=1 Tax=Sphaceloma murrayae TaxID=2082308 RepID=A0A2K1QGL9_9PEZI|nr:hypothetical protein CAC42_6545 [Sphaceloma murrayae]